MRGAICHATQLSGEKRGYTLPFAVPASADFDVHYLFGDDGLVCLNLHLVAPQNDIVPPEKPTSGYGTINLSVGNMLHPKTKLVNGVMKEECLSLLTDFFKKKR